VLPGQGSGMLTSMLGAQGLVFFPEGKRVGQVGEMVQVLCLSSLVGDWPGL